jgi:hypothetical protein
MRTTLTLDPDVASRVDGEVRRTGKALKVVVNDALRAGLGLLSKPPASKPFEVRTHSFGFKPGIDLDRMNQLVDELETEEALKKLRRDHP